MFRWLIERPTTYYGFLSGIFMSVATTALSNFALAAETPQNVAKLITAALIAFGAATCWFWLGEYISLLKERVRSNQEGVPGTKVETYQKAIQIVGESEGQKLCLLFVVAIACSLLWPFV